MPLPVMIVELVCALCRDIADCLEVHRAADLLCRVIDKKNARSTSQFS
jgi:hypothetical protein